MTFSIYTSPAQASMQGATHHANLLGFIPGYVGDSEGEAVWVSLSDMLSPIEIAALWLWDAIAIMTGHEAGYLIRIGKPIEVPE